MFAIFFFSRGLVKQYQFTGRDMPLQKTSGVAILVSLQECGFFQNVHRQPILESHRSKLGLRRTQSKYVKPTTKLQSPLTRTLKKSRCLRKSSYGPPDLERSPSITFTTQSLPRITITSIISPLGVRRESPQPRKSTAITISLHNSRTFKHKHCVTSDSKSYQKLNVSWQVDFYEKCKRFVCLVFFFLVCCSN